jgi:hypothetical protein
VILIKSGCLRLLEAGGQRVEKTSHRIAQDGRYRPEPTRRAVCFPDLRAGSSKQRPGELAAGNPAHSGDRRRRGGSRTVPFEDWRETNGTKWSWKASKS